MLANIDIYELPDDAQHTHFHIYEVRGATIQNKTYPHKTDRPHRHRYYEICVFVNGAGRHEIDFKTHSIHSHSVHFITPGQVHLISREEDYHGYLLVFSKDFYSLGAYTPAGVTDFPLFDNHTQVPILNLREQEFETLLGLIGQLKKEYLANEDFSLEILRSYLHIFLLKCRVYHLHYHAEREKLHHPHYEQVRQFKAMVEAQFSKVHLVKDYADQLAVTPVSLNKHVKSITGTTASEFIIDRLVLEAKRLLMYTDLSNKEIAYRMSYDDPSYFSRIFKKKTGLTPTEFKERMHKKYQL